jgi:hypothetical protein
MNRSIKHHHIQMSLVVLSIVRRTFKIKTTNSYQQKMAIASCQYFFFYLIPAIIASHYKTSNMISNLSRILEINK